MVNNMKKRKRRKKDETSSFKYSVELTGLFLILIGIIGFGFGPVGALLKKFSIFFNTRSKLLNEVSMAYFIWS